MTSQVTGTRNGYTCPSHRASAELQRRNPFTSDGDQAVTSKKTVPAPSEGET
jgi:hypothetical protein